MKTFLQSLLGALTALLLVAGVIAIVAAVAGRDEPIEDHSWLVVELHGDLPEYDPPGGVLGAVTGGDTETLQRVLDGLTKAAADERIEGAILHMSADASIGRGKSQEIRGAVQRLRAAGKKVYGWAESFSTSQYLALSACDEIYAPPTAYITFTGFAARTSYIREALTKLGIEPNIHKIKDYKSAAELVLRTDMSPEARDNRQWLIDDLWQQWAAALAADRQLDEERVVAAMEHALFTAQEAKDAGLLDELLYWDELEARLLDAGDAEDGEADGEKELPRVSAARYASVGFDDLDLDGDDTVAVIHAQGTIAGRENSVNPLLGMTMGHETIVAELRRARRDEDVKAVILRVDSGGGDSLGSDLMGHEVEITAAVKPVVVSMVDVAASGGYHISYRGSRILADPMTITGSIGSISGKFNVKGLHDKLGITHDLVTSGPNADFYSSYRNFTEEERARFEDDHWQGFNAWLRDVAEHRGMSFEEAETLAHGRVWTGVQAKENGLVDDLGDLHRAIEVAKELAELPADQPVTVAHYPAKKSLVESILGGDAAAAVRWAVYRAFRDEVRSTAAILEQQPELLFAPPLP